MANASAPDILTAMRTVLDNVDTNCVCKTMATCKAIALKIDSKELLEEVAELIHQRVLNKPNLTVKYVELCSVMMHSQLSKTKSLNVTLLQVLLPKCYDVFYTYKTKRNQQQSEVKQTTTFSSKQNDQLLANSIFISELYNSNILPESNFRKFLTDLVKEYNNAQVHCLAAMLKSAGTKLSKTYSLSTMVGHLLVLAYDSSRNEIMNSSLRSLIEQVKILHAKFWIHEVPDRATKKILGSVNENLIKPNKTRKERRQYELCLMAECCLNNCRDLLSKFKNRKDSDEIKSLLSPVIDSSIKTDQLAFAVHMIVTVLNEKSLHVIAEAAKLLADLVKAKLLAKFVVYIGFDKMRKLRKYHRNLVLKFEDAYTNQLNTKVKV